MSLIGMGVVIGRGVNKSSRLVSYSGSATRLPQSSNSDGLKQARACLQALTSL